MKIAMEKYLSFADQPKPLLAAEVPQQIPPRKPLKPLGPVQVDIKRFIPTEGVPKLTTVMPYEKGSAILRVANFNVGQHMMPPNIEAKAIPSLGARPNTFSKVLVSNTFLPDHLALQPVAAPLPEALRTPAIVKLHRDD